MEVGILSNISITTKKRLIWLLVLIISIFVALIVRLAWIQIKWGPELKQRAYAQSSKEITIAAERGTIYDRNGRILAQSSISETLVVVPAQISDPDKVADKLAPILNMKRDDILKALTNKNKSEIWLKRQMSKQEADAVRALNLKGVKFVEETKRYYPNENLASQVLGFVGKDRTGLAGIELQYEEYLKGQPGKMITRVDGKSKELATTSQEYIEPKNGDDIYLTIDAVIQNFTEKAIEQAMKDNNAQKAIGVVMDPQTGEILAIANKPDFNPNGFPTSDLKTVQDIEKVTRNAAIQDAYEPGSTFKIITASAALEAGAVKPSDTFYCHGYITVAGQKIKCWRSYNPHGRETFTEAMQNSCNPVFVEVEQRLGVSKFYNYIKLFGFGQKTGLDFPGESPGLMQKQANVGPVELATISFGQGISVTPVQLMSGISTAINGGNLMKPHLMKRITSVDNEVLVDNKPQVERQVISENTSATLRSILESVVTEGTGNAVAIDGYRIGGKTGTAETYKAGKYISSFVAFAPADNPKIAVLVIVEQPNAGTYFGSTVAAPAVKSILSNTFDYWGITPTKTASATSKEKKSD